MLQMLQNVQNVTIAFISCDLHNSEHGYRIPRPTISSRALLGFVGIRWFGGGCGRGRRGRADPPKARQGRLQARGCTIGAGAAICPSCKRGGFLRRST